MTTILGCLGVAACGDAAHPRAQLLVYVDTNALLPDLARQDSSPDEPGLSQISVDTLRVDVLSSDGKLLDYQHLVAPSGEQWPVSFGVAAEDVGEHRLVARLRLFAGRFAAMQASDDHDATLDPEPAVSIDRLIALEFPREGVRRVSVMLDAECIGVPAKFAPELGSCVDDPEERVAPEAAFEDVASGWRSSQVGTWERLASRPCRGKGPEGSVCIPGGFFLFGEPSLALPPNADYAVAYPFRPVWLSPFWMDRAEFTVGRLNAFLEDNSLDALEDTRRLTFFEDCTWRASDDPESEQLPLNCVTTRNAERLCNAAGGTLPSEAQWEYAARGRNARWRYPWGDAAPECCGASLSRLDGSEFESLGQCTGYGPVAANSVQTPSWCPHSDESFDGVLHLGGNLSELTLDEWVGLDEGGECWPKSGILTDPSCRTDAGYTVSRGGNWGAGMANATSALRSKHLANSALPYHGFRCVYEDEP